MKSVIMIMTGDTKMTLNERARERRKRIVTGRSRSYDEAELWDLKYWQSLTPAERLEAYMAIRRDVEVVQSSRGETPKTESV